MVRKGASTFAFDDGSRMKCANCGTPQEVTYTYDGSGTRVSAREAGVVTYFMYGQSGQLLWEEKGGGEIKEYIYAGSRQIATRIVRP